MQTPFLRQVADHFSGREGIGSTLFIFPNRRSLVFFEKYLRDIAVERAGTMLMPRMVTVSSFYAKLSGAGIADRITLLQKLYACYAKLNPKAESFDEFIYWGDVILGDFNDVDKYLVDARMLFSNISDLKALQDDYSYADPTQREALEKLALRFTDGNWAGRGAADPRDVKHSFLSVWSLLYRLYSDFRATLSADGLAYEGMIYRGIVERCSSEPAGDLLKGAYPDVDRCAFVGLNVLSRSEKEVMRKLRDAGLADFCWDFNGGMLTDPANIAGRFLRENLEMFPNAFHIAAEDGGKPRIHVVSVPSATGQAKLLPSIIDSLGPESPGLDFAVVLADETMLMPVLSSIPERVKEVNITMGYPLKAAEWTALMNDVLELQMTMRQKGNQWFFYHRKVYDILSSGIIRSVLDEDERSVVDAVMKEPRYYIPQSAFGDGRVLGRIFTPVTDAAGLADYQIAVIEAVATLPGGDESPETDDGRETDEALQSDESLQLELAYQYLKCVKRLRDLNLKVLPKTWAHLLEQVVAGVSVPFEGEPLAGMQVMGPLETRALDFRNIVILNANEGAFPRRSVSSSFIPPELREAFALPTYVKQDAMWAYYFYRLLSRAENVWMLYDCRTEGLTTGEESRFIKQLRYLYPDFCILDESVARAGLSEGENEDEIVKTPEDIEKARNATYSPSSIEKYLACPVQFYYYVIKKLKPEDEVKESVDAQLLGTVCHDTLEALYTGEKEMLSDEDFDKRDREDAIREYGLPLAYLREWAGRTDDIRRKVHSVICNKLHCLEVSGRDLVTADVAVRYVRQVVRSDIRLLEKAGRDSLTIYGLEVPQCATICGHRFFGYLDRIDSIDGVHVRVVDYKTGSDRQDVLAPDTDVLKVFAGSDRYKYKAALQFHIYDRFLQKEFKGKGIRNAMYSISDIFRGDVVSYDADDARARTMDEELGLIFDEIENPDVNFCRVPRADNACKFCDFKVLCGR